MLLPPVGGALSFLFAAQVAASAAGGPPPALLAMGGPSTAAAANFNGTASSALVNAVHQQQMVASAAALIAANDAEEDEEEEGEEDEDEEEGDEDEDESTSSPSSSSSSSSSSSDQRRNKKADQQRPQRKAEAGALAEHPYIVFARSIYSWLVPTMVAILLIAVLGNGLIVVSAPWLSGQASHYNWLCVSLAGADAWAASLLVAGLILNSYMPVVLKIAWDGKCVAALFEIFRISGMLTSNLHILALAANQFLGICHPLLYKTTITTERVRALILLLWIIPICFVGAWFISVPGDSLFADGCRHEFYARLPFRLYIFVAFASILLLTVLIYAHILVKLLRQKARYRLRRNSVLYSYRRRVQSKMKLLTTTLLILSTFTLSWGVCVLYFVLVCKQGCPFIYLQSISFQTGLLLNSSVNFLVALKLVLNPLIYALRMCHIRKSVAELFGAAIRSRSPSSQLLTLRPMSRQLSSPRPFTRADDHHNQHNHHSAIVAQSSLSDPPSRTEACAGGGSDSSRELLSGGGGQKGAMKGDQRRRRKGSAALARLLQICGGGAEEMAAGSPAGQTLTPNSHFL